MKRSGLVPTATTRISTSCNARPAESIAGIVLPTKQDENAIECPLLGKYLLDKPISYLNQHLWLPPYPATFPLPAILLGANLK